MEDVKNSFSDLPIGVVTLPPKTVGETRNMYGNAQTVLTNLGAEVIDEENVKTWAARMADLVPIK